MKLLFFVLASLLCSHVRSQSIDTTRIQNICDSVLLANTSAEFFTYVSQFPKRTARNDFIPRSSGYDESMINDSKYMSKFVESKYRVVYELRLPNGDSFLLREDTIQEVQSWGSPIVGINLDMNFRVVDNPDYSQLLNTYNFIKRLNPIPVDSAKDVALPYFTIKVREHGIPILELDIRTNSYYWRITGFNGQRTKSRRKMKEEQIFINAETGEFSEIKQFEYPVEIGY